MKGDNLLFQLWRSFFPKHQQECKMIDTPFQNKPHPQMMCLAKKKQKKPTHTKKKHTHTHKTTKSHPKSEKEEEKTTTKKWEKRRHPSKYHKLFFMEYRRCYSHLSIGLFQTLHSAWEGHTYFSVCSIEQGLGVFWGPSDLKRKTFVHDSGAHCPVLQRTVIWAECIMTCCPVLQRTVIWAECILTFSFVHREATASPHLSAEAKRAYPDLYWWNSILLRYFNPSGHLQQLTETISWTKISL